jgi:4-hydroxyphenylpyruvate dioxygenase
VRKSTATVSLSGDLAGKLHACAEAGFDGIEVFEPDLVVAPESPGEIRELAARLGLTLELYQPFRDFEAVDEDSLQRNLDRAAAKFDVMRELGVDTMLLCSNVATAVTGDPDITAGHLRRLAELAAVHDVRVAYEALAWGRYVDDYRDAWALVQAVDHPNLGLCLDSFHILSRGHDPAGIEEIPGEKIFFLQIADAPRLGLDVLSWSRHHRLFPGEGGFDLPTFLAHVLRTGYSGPLSLEVFNDVFRQTDTRRTAAHSLRSLVWLEDETAARLGDEPAARQLARLTAAGGPVGVTFAEVRAGDTEPVENALLRLGFTYQGHHRSKAVRLWTHGGARIVLNEQQARGREPWLAALGLDVLDTGRAVARARELRAPQVFRRTHAGEEILEAVAAPDGTEIFLCPPTGGRAPAWAGEFGPAAELSAVPQLIVGIDHVNLVEPWESYDEAVLFYESLLSLDATTGTEVAAPTGLVRSQVMTGGKGEVRLALNVPPGRPGSPAVPLSQHVAFAATDVLALAERAREAGLAVLRIPRNYYADLAARFTLPAAFLDRLRALDVLYDRDGNGDFLHFYTEAIGDVFFEVVERRDGYDGYGAPNAPVRLAAQYRAASRAPSSTL